MRNGESRSDFERFKSKKFKCARGERSDFETPKVLTTQIFKSGLEFSKILEIVSFYLSQQSEPTNHIAQIGDVIQTLDLSI